MEADVRRQNEQQQSGSSDSSQHIPISGDIGEKDRSLDYGGDIVIEKVN